jgi:hypothetical protein
LQYLANRDADNDAWAVKDDDGVSIQQKIWNFVYGDRVPHIITVQGPVFALVSFPILLPGVLITSLSRSINVFVNGAVDLLLLPCPLSMLSSMTTTMILTIAVRNLPRPFYYPIHSFTVAFPIPRMAR